MLIGYLVSCTVLLVLSWLLFLLPHQPWSFLERSGTPGVPVKDYIAQATEFAAAAFLLVPVVLKAWREQRRPQAVALSLLALAFLVNVAYVAHSRTALVVVPVLVLLLAWKHLGRRGMLGLLFGAVVAAALVWTFAPAVRGNITDMLHEVTQLPIQRRADTGRRAAGVLAEVDRICGPMPR